MKARRVVFSEQNQTKTLAQFTKTILVGGSLIVLPVYVSLLLLAKAVSSAPGHSEADHGRGSWLPWNFAGCWPSWRLPPCVSSPDPRLTLLWASPDALPVRPMNQALRRRSSIEEALVPAMIVEKLKDGSYTVLMPPVPTDGWIAVHPTAEAGASG